MNNKTDNEHTVGERHVVGKDGTNVGLMMYERKDKEFQKVLNWSKKYMQCVVTPVRDGLKICTPNKSVNCWIAHPDDKGVFDFYRYLARAAKVKAKEIEMAYREDRAVMGANFNEGVVKKPNYCVYREFF
jgi:hypothetical protein